MAWRVASRLLRIQGLIFALGLMALAQLAGQTSGNGAPVQKPSDAAPATEVPKKPAEILQLASTMNGLDIASAKPWHVKLSFDEFDEDGDNVHSGTFEEFYVGPKKYRRIYEGDTLTQTDIGTESGLYRSGDQRWPSFLELQVRNEALDPLYRARRDARNTRPDKIDWQVGNAKLPCVILRGTDPFITISDNGLRKFCFDPGTVRLRYTRGRGWDETTYNNFVLFQGRYVGRDITVTQGGQPYLKIHIEDLETISKVGESLFTPSPGSAGPLAGRIAVTGDVLIDEYVVSEGHIVSPRTARGTTDVKFVVGKDGRVIQADAENGPVDLQKAAVAAMRAYRFRPFLILDQPVEVESSMSFEVH